MRTVTVGLLLWIAGIGTASAQSTVTTSVERDHQGRVSSITTTSENGTARTRYIYTATGTQETTTYEPVQRGYNPLGHGGYRPLGR